MLFQLVGRMIWESRSEGGERREEMEWYNALRFRGVGMTRPKAGRLAPDNFYLGTERWYMEMYRPREAS